MANNTKQKRIRRMIFKEMYSISKFAFRESSHVDIIDVTNRNTNYMMECIKAIQKDYTFLE